MMTPSLRLAPQTMPLSLPLSFGRKKSKTPVLDSLKRLEEDKAKQTRRNVKEKVFFKIQGLDMTGEKLVLLVREVQKKSKAVRFNLIWNPLAQAAARTDKWTEATVRNALATLVNVGLLKDVPNPDHTDWRDSQQGNPPESYYSAKVKG